MSSEEVKLILVGTSQIPARQRFTIAHELGHLLQGDDQQLHVDANVYDTEYRLDESEQRANAFAAALLMPMAHLKAAVGAAGLSESEFAGWLMSSEFRPAVWRSGFGPTAHR